MNRFVIITNYEETFNGFTYKDGLNVLDKPFEIYGTCVKGGLYFTKLEYIYKFYGDGIYLRKVILPKEDPEFKMIRDPTGYMFRANKIILGKRYCLLDFNTYIKFSIDVRTNNYLIYFASKYGRLDVLEQWKNNKIQLKYSNNAIDSASENGHIEILEWWKNISPDEKIFNGNDFSTKSFSHLKYSCRSMDSASAKGLVDVLEWWKNSGLKLKYSCNAIELASANGQIKSLQWWSDAAFNDNLELFYHIEAIDLASANGKIQSLEWWKNSNLDLMYSVNAINFASANGHSYILEWWENSGLDLVYTNDAINLAFANGYWNILEWWKNSTLTKSQYAHEKLICSSKAIDAEPANEHIEILE